MRTVEIITDSKSIKKPELFSKNTLHLFAPKKIIFKAVEYTRIDTCIETNIPKNTGASYCSLNRDFTQADKGKSRIYLGLLNKSFIKDFCAKKEEFIGFICSKTKTKKTFNHAAKNLTKIFKIQSAL